jgi:hypothetical protein
MLFFLLRFLQSQFSPVKGKAQISICPSIGIAILEAYILEHKTRFMGFGKVKAFWFWVILGLISKKSIKSLRWAPCETTVNRESIVSIKPLNCLNEPAKKVRLPQIFL